MSDTEEMEPESKIFLPASQLVGHENEQTVQTEPSQNSKTDQTEPSQNSKTSKTAKPKKPTGAVQYPCIYCGNNAAKGVVQCTICALWCHMSCTGVELKKLYFAFRPTTKIHTQFHYFFYINILYFTIFYNIF